MLTKRRFLQIATALAAGALSAAPAQAQQLEEVTYLLPAPAFLPAFGPWMLAQTRGYYAKEGLKVAFVAAQGGPVKAVAVLGGRSLMQLAVHSDKGIAGPKDLKGRTITTMAYQDTTFYALLGMLATAGLTKNDVDAQAAGPAGVWQLFAAGKADAMAAVPDWIASARGAGAKVDVYSSDEYFKSMAQAILASDELIEKRPDLIRKLVRATLRGMQDIMKDPAGSARDYVSAVPQNKGKGAYIEAVF